MPHLFIVDNTIDVYSNNGLIVENVFSFNEKKNEITEICNELFDICISSELYWLLNHMQCAILTYVPLCEEASTFNVFIPVFLRRLVLKQNADSFTKNCYRPAVSFIHLIPIRFYVCVCVHVRVFCMYICFFFWLLSLYVSECCNAPLVKCVHI